MPALIANISSLNEEATRQLTLHAEAEVHRVGYLQVRVNGIDRAEQRVRRRRASRRIREVAVIKVWSVDERRNVHL